MIDETKLLEGTILTLEALGTNLDDENFKGTPQRIVRSYKEILRAEDKVFLKKEVDKIFSALFPSKYKGIVQVKNIRATSMCPHHQLIVKYNVDIGYISNPDKKGEHRALGISKLPRFVKLYAAQRILQETYTEDLIDILMYRLNANGAMVIVRGDHSCMTSRGVNEPDAVTITSSVAGIFEKDIGARQEFLSLLSYQK